MRAWAARSTPPEIIPLLAHPSRQLHPDPRARHPPPWAPLSGSSPLPGAGEGNRRAACPRHGAIFLAPFFAPKLLRVSKHLSAIHIHALDFWMARASVTVIVALQLLLVNRLTVGPRWLAPAAELALLVPLSIATAWAQHMVVKASTDHHWHMIARWRRMIRGLAVTMTGIISLINFGSLAMLVTALLGGTAEANGRTLLVDALDIWAINVIAFALWYWSMDHGGPAARGVSYRTTIDF